MAILQKRYSDQNWPADGAKHPGILSRFLVWVLVGIFVVCFVLFYLVGWLVLLLLFCFLFFTSLGGGGVGGRVSLYNFGCPETHHGLKLTEVSLPLTPECQVLVTEVCTIMPNLFPMVSFPSSQPFLFLSSPPFTLFSSYLAM